MRATRAVSGLELRLRRALWAAGVRGYRVQATLPGRPDLVFPSQRIAVFVHGCYWHRCPACELREPVANAAFWRAKFTANQARDRSVAERLRADGWEVETVWEHEIRRDVAAVVHRLAQAKARAGHPRPVGAAGS